MQHGERSRDLEALGVLAEPLRRRLYEYVARRRDAVGRDEAAGAVGTSRGLAAFHLDRLADEGLLVAEYRRLSGRTGRGAGRPAKLYRRALREFEVELPPRRYAVAATVFGDALAAMGDAAAPVVTDAALRAGRQLAADGDVPATPGLSKDARLFRALERGGYEPFRDPDGVVRLANCPFHAIKEQHPSLACGMNLALARGLLETLGGDGICASLEPQPGICCVALGPCRDGTPGGERAAAAEPT